MHLDWNEPGSFRDGCVAFNSSLGNVFLVHISAVCLNPWVKLYQSKTECEKISSLLYALSFHCWQRLQCCGPGCCIPSPRFGIELKHFRGHPFKEVVLDEMALDCCCRLINWSLRLWTDLLLAMCPWRGKQRLLNAPKCSCLPFLLSCDIFFFFFNAALIQQPLRPEKKIVHTGGLYIS